MQAHSLTLTSLTWASLWPRFQHFPRQTPQPQRQVAWEIPVWSPASSFLDWYCSSTKLKTKHGQYILNQLHFFVVNLSHLIRLTFPTVTATTTPLQVLPQFVDVLGRKVDKVQTELDRLFVMWQHWFWKSGHVSNSNSWSAGSHQPSWYHDRKVASWLN